MAFLYALSTSLLVAIGIEGIRGRLTGGRLGAWFPKMLTTVLLLIVVADAYTRTRFDAFHPVLGAEKRGASDELIAHLQRQSNRDRVFVETKGLERRLLPKMGMMNGVFALPDYEPSLPGSYLEYFDERQIPPWLGDLHFTAKREPARPEHEMLRLLDLMSVRYYATASPSRDLREIVGADRVSTLGGLSLMERPATTPRVYAVHHTEVEPESAMALARLLDESFQPSRTAVVDREVPELGPPGGTEVVTITTYATEQVTISAECTSDCLVVLTDLYYPGWVATLDGRPAEIYRVNHLFRGVRVPAGSHEIVFRYRPVSFRIGVLLFAATLGLTACVFGAARLRRRAP
jgi:hypothetical protein